MSATTARRVLLLVLAPLVVVAGVAVADQTTQTPARYLADGQAITSLRPTGVGLPKVGASGTVGAGDLVSALRTYHDSGLYDRDLATVDHAAQAYVDGRLKRRVSRPAIVLDIDETSLSNYAGLAATGFSSVGTVAQAATGTGAVITPTLALFKDARAHGVVVFFVTGRPAAIATPTEANLRAAGYTGWSAIDYKPDNATTEAYKSATRAALQQQGYDILANVGDQESDLDGGHSDAAFKLPNPYYFISD